MMIVQRHHFLLEFERRPIRFADVALLQIAQTCPDEIFSFQRAFFAFRCLSRWISLVVPQMVDGLTKAGRQQLSFNRLDGGLLNVSVDQTQLSVLKGKNARRSISFRRAERVVYVVSLPLSFFITSSFRISSSRLAFDAFRHWFRTIPMSSKVSTIEVAVSLGRQRRQCLHHNSLNNGQSRRKIIS